MTCPALNVEKLFRSTKHQLELVRLYVVMDGVELLRNLKNINEFQYFPDPVFFPFSGENKLKQFDVSTEEFLELSVSKLLYQDR